MGELCWPLSRRNRRFCILSLSSLSIAFGTCHPHSNVLLDVLSDGLLKRVEMNETELIVRESFARENEYSQADPQRHSAVCSPHDFRSLKPPVGSIRAGPNPSPFASGHFNDAEHNHSHQACRNGQINQGTN